MVRIGFVDLDTSHPGAWIPSIRSAGHTVDVVFDHGDVHPPGYAAAFAAEHGIPRVAEHMDQVAEWCDCVVVGSCNWDLHVERATPFVKAGLPVLIDKPIAGRQSDLERVDAWTREGRRVTGGSSLRCAAEVLAFRARSTDERGEPDTVVCTSGTDAFNYGIHAASMLIGLVRQAPASVRHLGAGAMERIHVSFPSGVAGILLVARDGVARPFTASVTTTRGTTSIVVDSGSLYSSWLGALLPWLDGSTDTLWAVAELCAPERILIAAALSESRGGDEVLLEELPGQFAPYDGAAFTEKYRHARYTNG